MGNRRRRVREALTLSQARVDHMTAALVYLSPSPGSRVKRVDINSISTRTGHETDRTAWSSSDR